MRVDFKKFEAFNRWRREASETALYEWMRTHDGKIFGRVSEFRFWNTLSAVCFVWLAVSCVLGGVYPGIFAINQIQSATFSGILLSVPFLLKALNAVAAFLILTPLLAAWALPKDHWLDLFKSGFLAEVYVTPVAGKSILASASMLSINRIALCYLAIWGGSLFLFVLAQLIGTRIEIAAIFVRLLVFLTAAAPFLYPLLYLTETVFWLLVVRGLRNWALYLSGAFMTLGLGIYAYLFPALVGWSGQMFFGDTLGEIFWDGVVQLLPLLLFLAVFIWYSCPWSQKTIVECEREFVRVFDAAPQ